MGGFSIFDAHAIAPSAQILRRVFFDQFFHLRVCQRLAGRLVRYGCFDSAGEFMCLRITPVMQRGYVTRRATLNGDQSVQLQQGSAQLTVEQHTQRMSCHLAVQA